jgi:hypothetical protein
MGNGSVSKVQLRGRMILRRYSYVHGIALPNPFAVAEPSGGPWRIKYSGLIPLRERVVTRMSDSSAVAQRTESGTGGVVQSTCP